jgi:thermitase
MLRQIKRSAARSARQWNLDNDGTVGTAGADVSAVDAWKITKGDSVIRVAVLDEGVDSLHPALNVVAEYDAVDRNSHARPAGNDAHGTACAGIIASRDRSIRGLAPDVSLVGVRIAKSDDRGEWISDDFSIADAIDWAWRETGGNVDVLSNSWGGGPPVDAITRAFERARKRGRRGKGCVIAIAASNEDSFVTYPGTLPNVLTVGATNQWDERKTPTSRDGEDDWGSNHGRSLDIMAPGVAIRTTDISGRAGYTRGKFVDDFNGTSAATPHVAAAAAMILSIKPSLKEAVVRRLITRTADRIGGIKKRDDFVGNGRLNIAAALKAAKEA